MKVRYRAWVGAAWNQTLRGDTLLIHCSTEASWSWTEYDSGVNRWGSEYEG